MHLTIISEAFAFKRYRVNTVGGSYGFDRDVNSFDLKKPNFLILAPWHESQIGIFENACTYRVLLGKIYKFFFCPWSDCFWRSKFFSASEKKKWPFFKLETTWKKIVFKKYFLKLDPSSRLIPAPIDNF